MSVGVACGEHPTVQVGQTHDAYRWGKKQPEATTALPLLSTWPLNKACQGKGTSMKRPERS